MVRSRSSHFLYISFNVLYGSCRIRYDSFELGFAPCFHICHVVIMLASQIGSCALPALPCPSLRSYIHAVTFVISLSSTLSPIISAHKPSVHRHPTTICSRVSSSPHTGHPRATIIPRRMRFILTATAFVAKHHTKFSTLGITSAPHIARQRSELVVWF